MRFSLPAIVATVLLTAGPLAAAPVSAATAPGRIEMTDAGPLVVSPDGRSLYTFQGDEGRPGHSACSNIAQRTQLDMGSGFGVVNLPRSEKIRSCAEWFPPFLAGDGAKADGPWGIIKRPEGTRQWTYRNRPLHFSARDKAPGNRFGVVMGFQLATDVVSLGLPPGISLGSYGEDLVLTAGQKLIFARTEKAICQGECADRFRALPAPELARPQGDWSVTTAAGQRQYTFKGKPLFVPTEDMTPRDIEALGGWRPVVFRKGTGTPPEIGKQLSLAGELYTTRDGKTLYMYRCSVNFGGVPCDAPGEPARYMVALCGDAATCSERWKPYRAAANAKPIGDWSIVEITDPPFIDPLGDLYPEGAPKVKVWAYRGSPLYTYYLDTSPGGIRGRHVRTAGYRKFMTEISVPGRSLEGGDFQLR